MARGAAALKVVDEAHYANLAEVEEFAEGLPEKYLWCREMGHNWRPFSAGRFKDGGFERTLVCNRCRCKRQQTISRMGEVQQNKYIHPEGYLHKGMGRIVGDGRGVLRLASIGRIKNIKDIEEEAS